MLTGIAGSQGMEVVLGKRVKELILRFILQSGSRVINVK